MRGFRTSRNTAAQKFVSHSVGETLLFASKFARCLKPGDCVALEGDLGSGKTLFVKGIARGLGLKDTDVVKSPTFVLMHAYPTRIPLYHFDLYRLEEEAAFRAIGLEEFAQSAHAIACIEWAGKAKSLVPPGAFRIRLDVTGPRRRVISCFFPKKVTSWA